MNELPRRFAHFGYSVRADGRERKALLPYDTQVPLRLRW
jgi:hypothetical protein